jgi:hypothetical protein
MTSTEDMDTPLPFMNRSGCVDVSLNYLFAEFYLKKGFERG